jgi:predicted nucleotidyltransferase
MLDERILSGIRKAKEQFPDATFYVFGSRARGDARPDSGLLVSDEERFPDRDRLKWSVEHTVRTEGIAV